MRTLTLWMMIAVCPVAFAEGGEKDRFKVKASFCSPIDRIEEELYSCEENDLFLQHGEACLDKLDAESKSVSGFLPAVFSKNLDQRQAGRFDSSVHDEQKASAALAYLIGTTELAMREIQQYRENLALPPDHDEDDVTGGDVAGYVESVDCYAANKRNLNSLLADFDRRLGELRNAKQVADANAAKSQLHRRNIDASSAAEVKVLAGKGQGSVRAPASSKTPRKASTITGVEIERDKRAKAPLKTRVK